MGQIKYLDFTISTDIDSYKLGIIADVLEKKCPVYLFQTNLYAEAIASQIAVDGFINDLTNETVFMGKPIIPLNQVSNESAIISCVVLAKPLFVLDKLKLITNRVIDYFLFKAHSGLILPNVIFHNSKDLQIEFESNKPQYYWISSLLKDKESKDAFNSIIKFRLTSDLKYLVDFRYEPELQYFDKCVKFNDNEVFLDVGSFDGYTSLEFAKHCPSFKKIYVFEPDAGNLKVVQDNLQFLRTRIELLPFGLSDRESTLRFDSSGSSSKITVNGDIEIKVIPLDSLDIQDVTYIKMDIEGAEIEALKGSKQTIQTCHPKLAISVYHRIDDMWKIPELILSFRADYEIFLRHYTEGIIKTVMYFIPVKA